MKRILLASLVIASLGTATDAISQTVNMEDMIPSIGSSYVQALSTYMEPGNGGQNQTWDLSGLPTNAQFNTLIVSTSGQPGSTNFPTATFANIIEGSPEVGFSRAADNVLEVVGLYTPDALMTWPDPRTQLAFPLSYQSTFSDTYERQVDLGDGLSNVEIGTITAVVDGSGTLILPSGTYTDVLRIRIETEADLLTLLNGAEIASVPFTDVSHTYVKAGVFAPLLSFTNSDFAGQSSTSAVFYVEGVVGVEDVTVLRDLSLYPVPVRDHLTVAFQLEAATAVQISLFAMDGRLVAELGNFGLGQGANSVELEIPADLATGVYLVRLNTDKGMETRRIVVE